MIRRIVVANGGGFIVRFTQDEDGMWCAECTDLLGCFSQGKTRKEATDNIRNAIKEVLIAKSSK